MQSINQIVNLEPINESNLREIETILKATMGTPAGWDILNRDNAEEVIEALQEDHGKTGYYYAISLDQVVGFIGYRWRDDAGGYSLVTYLNEASRGFGVNLITKALLIQAFSRAGITLHAFIKEENIRSIKAMERILQKHDTWTIRKYTEKRSGKVLRHYSFLPTTVSEALWDEESVRVVISHLEGVINASSRA